MTPPPRGIVLVGFMGSGKSVVGRALAARLGWRFVDVDERIEQRAKRSITQIFSESDESVFRQLESAALRELLDEMSRQPATVVALGGGAPAKAENARMLAEASVDTVFLDAEPEELWRRVREQAQQGEERPLARDRGSFRRLYHERRSHYDTARLRIDTTGMTPEAAAAEISRQLGR